MLFIRVGDMVCSEHPLRVLELYCLHCSGDYLTPERHMLPEVVSLLFTLAVPILAPKTMNHLLARTVRNFSSMVHSRGDDGTRVFCHLSDEIPRQVEWVAGASCGLASPSAGLRSRRHLCIQSSLSTYFVKVPFLLLGCSHDAIRACRFQQPR